MTVSDKIYIKFRQHYNQHDSFDWMVTMTAQAENKPYSTMSTKTHTSVSKLISKKL